MSIILKAALVGFCAGMLVLLAGELAGVASSWGWTIVIALASFVGGLLGRLSMR